MVTITMAVDVVSDWMMHDPVVVLSVAKMLLLQIASFLAT